MLHTPRSPASLYQGDSGAQLTRRSYHPTGPVWPPAETQSRPVPPETSPSFLFVNDTGSPFALRDCPKGNFLSPSSSPPQTPSLDSLPFLPGTEESCLLSQNTETTHLLCIVPVMGENCSVEWPQAASASIQTPGCLSQLGHSPFIMNLFVPPEKSLDRSLVSLACS